MPLMKHKFSNQKAADKFSSKMRAAGYNPFQERRTRISKGLKRYSYIVYYNR